MDYAIQLLLPVLGGLLLGNWLTQTYHVSPIWTVVLAILGMVGGIGIMYRKFTDPSMYKKITPTGKTHHRPRHPEAPGKPYEHWTDIKKKVEESPDDDDFEYKDEDE